MLFKDFHISTSMWEEYNNEFGYREDQKDIDLNMEAEVYMIQAGAGAKV